MPASNPAARIGRWSAAHRKTAALGWIAFVILAFLAGSSAGTTELENADMASGEAATAEHILADAGFATPAGETVLVQSRTLDVTDAPFRATTTDVLDRLRAYPRVVTNIRSPLDPHLRGQISADGHAALVQFDVRGDPDTAKDRIVPVLKSIEAADGDHPGFFIGEFGQASAEYELDQTVEKDFQRAEVLALPVTLLILLIAFGALVAAGVPVLLGITGVLGALGLSALFSHLVPAADATASVILLIGMAVGVDYSLFYLRREREERAAGASPRDALAAAAATSGQAVLISGATVFVAMAGMLLAGTSIFTSIGVGAMIIVAVAIVGSVTVLPALLAILGDRIEKGRVPFLHRLRSRDEESGFWARTLTVVLRRPALSAALSGGLLLALCIPVLGMHTKLPSFTDLPKDIAIVDTYTRVQQAFPGAQTPAAVVVRADDVTAPPVRSAIERLRRGALDSGEMNEPISVNVNPARTVARVDIPLQGSGDDDASMAALATLRDKLIPSTVGRIDGAEVAVTGMTAGTKDFNDTMKARAPLVFGFVLGMAFLLMLITFRSIVIPLKAIVLNLLSVGAAYGVLVLVFQNQWAEGILAFNSNGGIASWLPLFLFVLLFGLSMDYHVFILSRVKELVDSGYRTGDAVAHGIKMTAGTVTSAAAVMVGVFAIFATLSSLDIKQMGFGLAVAVLIDATIIRAVLLPASMKLLGDWNWYLPKWLEWLPHTNFEAPAPVGCEVIVAGELCLTVERRPERVDVRASGELDMRTAPELADRLAIIEARKPKLLVLDLRALEFMDSAGLAQLIRAQRRAREDGRRLVLVTGTEAIDRVLAVSGVRDGLDTTEDPAAILN